MRKMHLIGCAHLDPVWLWDWREGFQMNKATFFSALARMEEFDDFFFTSTSAQFYKWIEDNEPEMFRKIQMRVKEGRWVICGGWWIQPDCNVPSGESFARQGLEAQNYFFEKFGVTAKTGFCPDSFGHNEMLPQILKKSGMDHYMFMRPMPHEKELPARTFLWQSPDGSRVICYRVPVSYHMSAKLREGVEEILAEPAEKNNDCMAFYGVGDHGGGPTVAHLNLLHEMQEEKKSEAELVFSHPDQFFADVRTENLPVVAEELQHHAPGCYAANVMMKTLNRRSENELLRAEKFAVLAENLGQGRANTDLSDAWQTLLFNQFHDTLAGSCSEEAYFDTRNQLGEVLSAADRVSNGAQQAISFHMGIARENGTIPMVVFNPNGHDVVAPVEMETGLFVSIRLPVNFKIVDADGCDVPWQEMESHSKMKMKNPRRRVTFMARVPALGYSFYRIVAAEAGKSLQRATKFTLENEYLKVEFDRTRGTIARLYDKKQDKCIIDRPVRARVIFDDTDTWGHSLVRLDDEVGEFTAVSERTLDTGVIRTAVRFTSRFGESTLTQTYSLYEGEDKLRINARVDWHGKRQALKLDFPVAVEQARAYVECPFGFTEKRTDGREEAMQSWADLSDAEGGLSIANDCKYSVDFRPDTIGVTVLRSPVYMHHDPAPLDEDVDYNYMDQGVSDFTLVLKPHAGDFRTGGILRDAMELNQPLSIMMETYHDGPLPLRQGGFSIDCGHVALSALKKAKKGTDTILRLYETAGEKASARVKLFDTEFDASFGPCEVKTFAIGKSGVKEVNLIEWED